jgi:hypothetical protein
MTALRTKPDASLNRKGNHCSHGPAGRLIGRVTPVRADDVNPTRRAEDCPPYQYEPATGRWLQIAKSLLTAVMLSEALQRNASMRPGFQTSLVISEAGLVQKRIRDGKPGLADFVRCVAASPATAGSE